MTVTIDPATVAQRFREEIRAQLQVAREPLHLVGILAGDHAPSLTYALYAQRACSELGIGFELRRYPRLGAENAIRSANADADVHGVIVYYPIFGTEQDVYLRELVDPGKDIEGLHSTWARHLYENRRFVDADKTRKAILPCTPLAIVKLVEAAGFFQESGRPLEGRTVTVFNRSEVVGRPLASMLAHDGANVYSFDVDGPLHFQPPPKHEPDAAHSLVETELTRAEALAHSDIVITGVPSKSFELVRSAELRPGALCINFSTYKNFADDVISEGKAGCFIPRVGPMTVLMVIRNALRLQRQSPG